MIPRSTNCVTLKRNRKLHYVSEIFLYPKNVACNDSLLHRMSLNTSRHAEFRGRVTDPHSEVVYN